jgi:hypothetical protein
MYPAPITKTSEDFPEKSPPATKDASLPEQLSRPPVPEYVQEEIFSGQLMERGRSGEA